jgi:hypothetical protein
MSIVLALRTLTPKVSNLLHLLNEPPICRNFFYQIQHTPIHSKNVVFTPLAFQTMPTPAN